eukprot:gene8809-9713_t
MQKSEEEEGVVDAPRPSSFSVGQRVRVLREGGEVARRAVIAFAHGNVDTVKLVGIFRARNVNLYDVIYDGKEGDEEVNVPEFRIMKVADFEEEGGQDVQQCDRADVWKDRGNLLFSQKDFSEASKCYQKALLCLSTRITVGATVMVIPSEKDINFPVGIVACIEGSDCEVMLSTGEDYECSMERVVQISDGEVDRQQQIALYKNLSRSSLKLQRKGWALRYISMAVATARSLETSEQGAKMLGDCLHLRAKVLIQCCRPAHAAQDARDLDSLDRSCGVRPNRSEEILKLVTSFKQRKQASDRRLAKEVAKWVDNAMQQQAQLQATRKSVDVDTGDDLPLDDEDGEELEEPSPELNASRLGTSSEDGDFFRPSEQVLRPWGAGQAKQRSDGDVSPANVAQMSTLRLLMVWLVLVLLGIFWAVFCHHHVFPPDIDFHPL